MKTRAIARLAVLLLLAACEAPSTGRGLWVRPSSDSLEDVALTADARLGARFDGVLAGLVPAKAPGLVVAVVRGDRRHVFAYGTTGDGRTTPPDEGTIFEIGSITKVFTGVMLAQRTLDGAVGLDAPVKSLVPPRVMPARSGRDITLLDLATHTSGLPRIPTDAPPDIGTGILYDVDAMFRFLAGHPLAADPGTRYGYSNLGTGLLGHALAVQVGEPYERWILRRVCEPLGMRDTRITLDATQTARLAKGRQGDARDPSNLVWPSNSASLASGAMQSTARDMIRFLEANLGLRPSPLDPALALAATPQRSIPGSNSDSMALLWLTGQRPGTTDVEVSKDGGTAGFASFIIFNRRAQIGLALLMNGTGASPSELGYRLLDQVYAPE